MPVKPEGIRARIDALVEQEDQSAESIVALARIVGGLVLAAVAGATWTVLADHPGSGPGLTPRAVVIPGGFILSGLLGYWLARSRFHRRGYAYVFLTLDAVLIGSSLHFSLESARLPGDFAAIFPVLWLPPLLLTVAVLRIRAAVQVFGLVIFTLVIASVALAHGLADTESRQALAGEAARYLAVRPNIMRLAMWLLAGATLILVAHRGRQVLQRALAEAERRAELTRFLPAEIAFLVIDGSNEDLRRGRRQIAAILFIDMRDSTAWAEKLDPMRLSTFIASFRRRVMRAAERHGGVVDKFVGDGALIVFGLPEARPDDARRALACARMLLALVDRWNQKREFDPPVRVGIGVHVGEVFFGVIGDEKRQELTVLGDAVNVGARLEQSTKAEGLPLLASAEVVEAAGESAGWTEVSREELRGRLGIIRVMRPA